MKVQICCKAETICAGLSVQDDIQRFYLLVCFRCKRGVGDDVLDVSLLTTKTKSATSKSF